MKKWIIALLLCACITNAYGENNRLLIQDLDLKVNISLEQEIHRIGKDIYLYVEVINQSGDVVKFMISPYKLNNIKIMINNLQNGEFLEERYSKVVEDNKLHEKRPEFFEFYETVLYSDEIYKFKINLPEYFEFKDRGRYKITLHYDTFPEDTKPHKKFISNSLYLVLKEPILVEDYKELIMYLKKKEEERVYIPEGTIKFMLDAYRQGNWEHYFLYLDLDTVILRYDKFKDKYNKASNVMKKEIIEEFKEWAKNRKEKVIEEYKILTVDHSYEKKTCVVTCKVKYKKPALYRTYFYEYSLHQEGIKWILDDIDVISYSKER